MNKENIDVSLLYTEPLYVVSKAEINSFSCDWIPPASFNKLTIAYYDEAELASSAKITTIQNTLSRLSITADHTWIINVAADNFFWRRLTDEGTKNCVYFGNKKLPVSIKTAADNFRAIHFFQMEFLMGIDLAEMPTASQKTKLDFWNALIAFTKKI